MKVIRSHGYVPVVLSAKELGESCRAIRAAGPEVAVIFIEDGTGRGFAGLIAEVSVDHVVYVAPSIELPHGQLDQIRRRRATLKLAAAVRSHVAKEGTQR